MADQGIDLQDPRITDYPGTGPADDALFFAQNPATRKGHRVPGSRMPGAGGSALPTRNIDDVPAAKALAVVAANVAALLETDTSYDGKSFLDDRDPNGIIFYWCRKARKVNPSDPQKLYWLRLPVL